MVSRNGPGAAVLGLFVGGCGGASTPAPSPPPEVAVDDRAKAPPEPLPTQPSCSIETEAPLRLEMVHSTRERNDVTVELSVLHTPIDALNDRLDAIAKDAVMRVTSDTPECFGPCKAKHVCEPTVNNGWFLSGVCRTEGPAGNGASTVGFTWLLGDDGFRPLRLSDLFRRDFAHRPEAIDARAEPLWNRRESFTVHRDKIAFHAEDRLPSVPLEEIRQALACPLRVAHEEELRATLGQPLPKIDCAVPSHSPLDVTERNESDSSPRRSYDITWVETGVPVIDDAVKTYATDRAQDLRAFKADPDGACGNAGQGPCEFTVNGVVEHNDGTVLSVVFYESTFLGGARPMKSTRPFNFVRRKGGWEILTIADVVRRPDELRMLHDLTDECFDPTKLDSSRFSLDEGDIVFLAGHDPHGCRLPVAEIRRELACSVRHVAESGRP